jgi:hypothetical protein
MSTNISLLFASLYLTVKDLFTHPSRFMESVHSVQFSSFFQMAKGDAKKTAQIQMSGTMDRMSRIPGGGS